MSNLEQVFASAVRRVFAVAETVVKFPVENAIPLDRLVAGLGRPTPESLPPVTVLRSSDLLDVTFRFVNLALKTDGSPHLVRDKASSPAFLIAVFGPQHLLEQAFFDDAGGGMQASPPTGTSPPPGPPSPSAGSESPIYPVKAILAKPSRLVFRVETEEIAYTEAGLISAMGRLPLSVVPHAESYAALLSWEAIAASVGAMDRVSQAIAAAIRNAGRSRAPPAHVAAPHLQPASELHAANLLTALSTYARTQRTASQIGARFGAYSAVAAVAQGVATADLLARVRGPRRRTPELRAPSDTETAIELPWRLQLSPHSKGAFAHSVDEVEHGGRVELWHTRLGTRVDAPPAAAAGSTYPSVNETDPATRTVRAVWTREFDVPAWAPTHKPLVFPAEDLGKPETLAPFRASLSQRDRMMIVHETSNYHAPGMPATWAPTPASVNHLMLTALGGWLDSEVRFPVTSTELTLEEWKHRATMGRDQYVKVVYSGLLHPFGHRASLVKVTERRMVPGDAHATLYQRIVVVVRQPERTFGSAGSVPQKNRMPFTWVRILTASTPPLALPKSLLAGDGQLFMPEIAGAASVGPGTEPFRFRVLARDTDNHLLEFEGPMVFIEDSRFGKPDTAAALAAANQTRISYPMRGQRVSYAAPGDADDTTLATASIQFDAELDAAAGPPGRNYILPVLKVATATVPALSAFTGQSDPVPLAYPDAYASHGFGGAGKNDGEVFLALVKPDGTAAPPVTMGFNAKSDRSGGFVSPGVDVTALARRVGPVGGDLASLANDAKSFDVGSMFGLDTAKLFGILPLAQLLPKNGGVLPKFVTQAVSSVIALQQAIGQVKSILVGQATALAAQAAAVRAAAEALAQRAAEFAEAVTGLAASPPVVADYRPILSGIHDAAALLLGTLTAADKPLALPRPVAEQLEALLRLLTGATAAAGDVDELIGLITRFYAGGLVPEVVNARLEWETALVNWPDDTTKIFAPQGDAMLRLVSEIRAPLKGGAPQALISCSLPPFQLRLMGDTHFISINVAVMEFSVKPGHKPDVNVRLDGAGKGIEFAGPLGFVETLKQIIPFDGFSDPPYLDISTSGVRAGFDLAIPDLPMGIFALTNIHLGAELVVPFIGESLEFRFFFATRENPFRLQVSFFAGGGFFAITISPKGLKVIEASFEFGAAVAMSFVVASGSLAVMAGIYFRLEINGTTQKVQLTGYFRARGEVDVLGLISACIELYLELSYFEDAGHAKAIGKASISIEVSVCFLSFSVSVSCEKKFAGSAGDPTFLAMMGPYTDSRGRAQDPWLEYCRAFAVEAV